MSFLSGFTRADKTKPRSYDIPAPEPIEMPKPAERRRPPTWVDPSIERDIEGLRRVWLERLGEFLSRSDVPTDWRESAELARERIAGPLGLDLARAGWVDVDIVGVDLIKPAQPRLVGLLFGRPRAKQWTVAGDEVEVIEPGRDGEPVRSKLKRPGAISGVCPIWSAPLPKPKALRPSEIWHETPIGLFRCLPGGGAEFWREGAPTRTLTQPELLAVMQALVAVSRHSESGNV